MYFRLLAEMFDYLNIITIMLINVKVTKNNRTLESLAKHRKVSASAHADGLRFRTSHRDNNHSDIRTSRKRLSTLVSMPWF